MTGVLECGAASVCVPVPPSTNNLFESLGPRRHATRAYKNWQEVAIPLLRTLLRAKSYPVVARLTVECAIAPNRDIDNLIKPILDAAVKAEAIAGDDRIRIVAVSITYDPRPAGDGVRVEFVPVRAGRAAPTEDDRDDGR